MTTTLCNLRMGKKHSALQTPTLCVTGWAHWLQAGPWRRRRSDDASMTIESFSGTIYHAVPRNWPTPSCMKIMYYNWDKDLFHDFFWPFFPPIPVPPLLGGFEYSSFYVYFLLLIIIFVFVHFYVLIILFLFYFISRRFLYLHYIKLSKSKLLTICKNCVK